MKARALALKIVLAALALTASSLWAQDGLTGALARMNLAAPANLGRPFSQTLAAADFDGDNEPDGAVLIDYGWLRPQSSSRKIELHFTRRSDAILTFESNEAELAISALDVNGDGATDIIVERPLTHKRLQVWLNDGRGGFQKGRVEDFPSASPDTGERLQSPSPQADCPVVCLGAQRGPETATLAVSPQLYRSTSVGNQALPFGLPIESRAAAPNSARAPPLS